MMDSLHQNHNPDHSDSHSIGAGFSFNNSQNDPYSSFFSNEPDSSFNSPWDTQAIPNPQDQASAFVQGNSAWHQNSLQPSNQLHVPNYGLPSRDFNHPFSRSPASFNYPGFDTQSGPPLSAHSYDAPLSYGNDSLNANNRFGFAGLGGFQRPTSLNETISPQALQNYSNPYSQISTREERQSQQLLANPGLALRDLPADRKQRQNSTTRPKWDSVEATIPAGTPRGRLLIRSQSQLSSATISKKFKGFVFLGNTHIDPGTPKVSLPRLNKRRSKSTARIKLLQEKGDGLWASIHQPLAKKLKISASKSSGSRQFSSSSTSRGTPVLEIESSPEVSSGSEPDEDSELDSESDEEPEEPSPLPSIRPTDPSKAVEYDTIKSVWAKRNADLVGPVIRTALGDYTNVIKGIRDKWKLETTALQQAVESRDQARTVEFQRRAAEQRRIMESAVRLTLKYGHRHIVEKLGEIPLLSVAIYQFIADRFKDSEYSGTFIASMLELMSRCITIDQALLEKTKVDKALQRLTKRGDDQGKTLAQKILDNAAAVSKQKSLESKGDQSSELKQSATFKKPASIPRPESSLGLKRQRPGDIPILQPAKKQAVVTAAARNTGVFGKKQLPTKSETKLATNAPSINTPAPKVKATHVVPKQSNFFSSLQSASKKPGTSNAALQSAKLKDNKVGNVLDAKTPAPVAATPKPTFSFAETMANLTKPKESVPSKSEDARPPESLEEKAKRLRKEERRKLHVTFKPDESLVETRIFVHDPEEEMGHEESMVRDVGDIRGEGQMLKMHRDLEVTDDEEDGNSGEETLAPWVLPTPIDFSVIEREELARNIVTRGGNVELKSRERAVQEQRELTTLMVVYTTISDIPPSPREPSDPYSGESSVEQQFGMPQEETKAREARFYGEQSQPLRQVNPVVTGPTQTPDIGALLKILNGQQQQAPQQIQQQPVTQAPPNGLEAIFAKFSGNNLQTPQMPTPVPVPQASTPGFNLQAALAAMVQPTQARPGYTVPPTSQTPDLQAILSQFNQQPAAQMQNYNYANQYQADSDRKRQYEYEYDEQSNGDYGLGKNKKAKGANEKKKYHGPKYPCKFWQEGKCRKGDDCTYLHE